MERQSAKLLYYMSQHPPRCIMIEESCSRLGCYLFLSSIDQSIKIFYTTPWNPFVDSEASV